MPDAVATTTGLLQVIPPSVERLTRTATPLTEGVATIASEEMSQAL